MVTTRMGFGGDPDEIFGPPNNHPKLLQKYHNCISIKLHYLKGEIKDMAAKFQFNKKIECIIQMTPFLNNTKNLKSKKAYQKSSKY